MSSYLFLLLLLACPLMMVWMMRGKHGGHDGDTEGGHGHGHAGGCGHGRAQGHGHGDAQGDAHGDGDADTDAGDSLEELRRRREQLDRDIEAREAGEEAPTPVGRVRR